MFILAGGYANSDGKEIQGVERISEVPQDAAYIKDFVHNEGDVIQLKGSADQYTVSSNIIYLDKNNDGIALSGDEIIGVVTTAQDLNLNNGFSFV